MKEWDENHYIIWKAAVQHYPMFPLHYPTSDFAGITNYFLPILQQHNFDLYFCGHEHLLAYASVPYPTQSSVPSEPLQGQHTETIQEERLLQAEVCVSNTEQWFGNP
jgi:hypothetical protein